MKRKGSGISTAPVMSPQTVIVSVNLRDVYTLFYTIVSRVSSEVKHSPETAFTFLS